MRRGLACLCVGALLAAGVARGEAPDKATLAQVRKLQEKRRDLLRDALEGREKLYQRGSAELGGVIEASKRLLAAELDLAAKDAERVAAHEKHLENARALVELAKARQQAARGTKVDVLDAQAVALEAEIGLLKAGGKPKKAEK
jgi:outer membrane protein TolC